MGLPRRPDRRAALPPDHELERGPAHLVGPVRGLEGRARDLGRDRARRRRRPLARATRAARTCPSSWTPARPRCWSRSRSAASATGSTRSCSASRRTCRGAWRSTPSTGPSSTPTTPRSTRRSSTRSSGTSALAAFLVWLGHHRRHPPAGPVRALRRRLLGVPDLRGADPRRPGAPRPRAAAEPVRRGDADDRRPGLVRALSGADASVGGGRLASPAGPGSGASSGSSSAGGPIG